MVTASRDSTVKMWEADWQIRMVFVGHTGVSGSPSLSHPKLAILQCWLHPRNPSLSYDVPK